MKLLEESKSHYHTLCVVFMYVLYMQEEHPSSNNNNMRKIKNKQAINGDASLLATFFFSRVGVFVCYCVWLSLVDNYVFIARQT